VDQVASEFLVTATFLMVTVGSWVLVSSGATAHLVLLPTPPAAIEPGCDACLCDLNAVIAGVDTGGVGGCAADRVIDGGNTGLVIPVTVPFLLCAVPKECADVGVQNATQAMQSVEGVVSIAGAWHQPGGFSWRTCAVGDPASDECDPTADPTRDNALAFLTVFMVQCCAIALGHVVMMWKLGRMVAENQQNRRRAMADPALERRARRFVANAKAEEALQHKDRAEEKMSAKRRFRRAVIVTKFGVRARKAAAQASAVESVDGVVLEISEAVAAHWKESLPFFVAGGTAAMQITFLLAGFVVSAQTA
jgi:hypothetical protein